jgi:ATP-dependent exoDNAse (exonuclease V) beta subunit
MTGRTAARDRSDGEARRLIAEAVDATLVVEAAAGTGKTTELITRMLRVIATGRADVRGIVAVTFTEKAAGELKLRLRQGLEDERGRAADPDAARRLDHAAQNLEEAHVSTIHGFCADLLRERPVEAGVDPLFRVLSEGQAEQLFDQAFAGWLQAELERPAEGVRRSLRRASRGGRGGDDDDGPIDRLRRAARDLAEWRDCRGAWTREPFDRPSAIARLVGLVHACADLSASPSLPTDNLFLDTAPVRAVSQAMRTGDALGADADLDGLEAQLVELRRHRDVRRARKGSGHTYGKGVGRTQVLEARDALLAALDEFQTRADADLAAALQADLLRSVDAYERLKAREGAMDFLDLLVRARDLVRDDAGVRRDFQGRFKRLFVDEFQDTDPLQAELLLLLSADDPDETRWESVTPVPGKLFVVGDPKQSIYRFRRADVGTYARVCAQLVARGAVQVHLTRSFRSVPNLQRAVNVAFRPVMDGNPATLQARYVPLEAHRPDIADQPSLVALPVPEPYGARYVSPARIEESLPDAVGAFVAWLVHESGWRVTERRRKAEAVPIEARHICMLFRRFASWGTDMTRPYVDALEARGIRHLLVGGRAFHDREEIETLRAALSAIEWPDDQLAVFATLRGTLFGIGDEELLQYAHGGRRFHPFRVPDALPSHLEPIADALRLLQTLHRQRNRRPVADTITALLTSTRAHVGFVLRPAGDQVLANVLHVAELARQYERDGGMSFRGFVEQLHVEASARQSPEAPILEEGSDGVRLMTVHKAKGLEFPVVILADITCRLAPNEPGRYLDPARALCAQRLGGWAGWSPKDLNDHRDEEIGRERAEGQRVTYVAATRARDLLVVPAVGDVPYMGGWIDPLNAAIYPAESARRVQASARGCPEFTSRDTVLIRPDGDPASSTTVCPGEHRTGTAEEGVSVVWWAPDVLPLGAQTPYGLRRDDLIVRDVSPAVLRSRLDAHARWQSAREETLARASLPSHVVQTVSEWAAAESAVVPDAAARIAVAVEETAREAARPSGARFGTLVHAVLASVPLAAFDQQTVRGLALAHGRVLGAEAAEIDAAVGVAAQVLAHPTIREAAQATRTGDCFREVPVTWRFENGALLEGHVDLAYRSGPGVVIVDFKTDLELEGALDRYRRQVQLYAAAVGTALGVAARAVLLRV